MKRVLKWLGGSLLAAILCAALSGAAFLWAETFLTVDRPVAKADVIVVLGGETLNRSSRAIELFQRGAASHILISGAGDAELIERRLLAAGIPRSAVAKEASSATTWENAILTARVLRSTHARRVILVTSWFHTRRASATFRHVMPEIEFFPAAARQDWSTHVHYKVERIRTLSREYLKLFWYLPRYGVWPWAA